MVYIEITKIETGDIIYAANHTIEPGKIIRSKPITSEAGKYTVKVVMDGKIKREKPVCVEKFTEGVYMEIVRYNGKLDIDLVQSTF